MNREKVKIGDTLGRLTVIGFTTTSMQYIYVRCICGVEKKINSSRLDVVKAIQPCDCTKPTARTCKFCGKTFYRRPKIIADYCSSSCYHSGSRQRATPEAIDRYSIPEPNSGCWLWTGSLTDARYGTLSIGRKLWGAHRLSYAVFVGDPGDLVVRHTC